MRRLPVLDRLEKEVSSLERELRVDIPKELEEAMAHGDLRENSEYKAAKERQSFLQARISHYHSRISSLSMVRLDSIPRDRVAFGAKVSLEDISTGEEVTYELVTPEEVDPNDGKISVASPIGRVILNKEVGDEVKIDLTDGIKEYEVTKIISIHETMEEPSS